MPGIVLRAIRDAGTNNPLFMIDEIDKTGATGAAIRRARSSRSSTRSRTRPSRPLSRPAFDLSKVMFITTANQLEPIRRRCATAWRSSLSPVTHREKLHIAVNYLVPKQVETNGLSKEQVRFDRPALREIIAAYTQERACAASSARSRVCRKLATLVAEGKGEKFRVTPKKVRELWPSAGVPRGQAAHLRRRRRHRPRLDAGRR